MGKKKKAENTTSHQSSSEGKSSSSPSSVPAPTLRTHESASRAPGQASWWRVHRTEVFIVVGIIVVGGVALWGFLVATGNSFLSIFQGGTSYTKGERVEEPVGRRLDGSPLAGEDINVYPFGVMIENLPSVRPQAGLSEAGIVYEALVEGLATRFLAFYELDGNKLPVIGPVRSARPYYVEWVSEYDALYLHAGGSPDALAAIDGFGIKDLNALYGAPGRFFYRERTLPAPHNLFTNAQLLELALRDTELREVHPAYDPWEYKEDADAAERPSNAQTLVINFSGSAYEVRYVYDPETNDYLRYNGGVEHTDVNTGEPIRVKNVVVQVIPPILAIEELGRLRLDVHGSGRAVIARDGQVIEGTWEKKDRTDRTAYRDSTGAAVEFNIGPTWIAVLPETQEVTVE